MCLWEQGITKQFYSWEELVRLQAHINLLCQLEHGILEGRVPKQVLHVDDSFLIETLTCVQQSPARDQWLGFRVGFGM
jgi:hypothetical protein